MFKNLIIKSSYSKLPNGELKSNLGDLLRTSVLLECIGKDFIWLTDSRAKNLLKWSVNQEKIIVYEKMNSCDFSNIRNIYNVDNYIADKKISSIKGNWHGYVLDRFNRIIPKNSLIGAITPYITILENIKKSWQQSLVEGMGFDWREQDYVFNCMGQEESIDIGLNWHVNSEWKSKQWPKENWRNLEKTLSKKYSISWQQGLDNFDEYVGWLSSCKMIVTGDTLGLHLASALKKNVIAIVGPTENREFSYKRITFIKPSSRECMPCNSPVCTQNQNTCLREITPQRINNIIDDIFFNPKSLKKDELEVV